MADVGVPAADAAEVEQGELDGLAGSHLDEPGTVKGPQPGRLRHLVGKVTSLTPDGNMSG